MSVECCSTAPFDTAISTSICFEIDDEVAKGKPEGRGSDALQRDEFSPENDSRDDVKSHEIRADFSEGIYPCCRPFLNGGDDNDDGDAR